MLNEKYIAINEVLQSRDFVFIETEINRYFDTLSQAEASSFLKWLELELLVRWKLAMEERRNQPESVKRAFSKLAKIYELKIDFLENWLTEKKQSVLKQRDLKGDTEIWHSEYELRQFIDTATRWSIDSVYNHKVELNNSYSIFDTDVKNSRQNFELFCAQLKKVLTKNNNWKAIEIDLKDRFLPMIDQYTKWYELNKLTLEKFNPNNPYKVMFSIIESTKKEIFKYFKESNNEKIKSSDNYKTSNLFKVGLLFAEGKMNKYFEINKHNQIVKKAKFSAPKIKKDIKENWGIDVSDKYILASFNEYTDKENKGKNIFCSSDMMQKIMTHCEAEKIQIDTYFKSRFLSE